MLGILIVLLLIFCIFVYSKYSKIKCCGFEKNFKYKSDNIEKNDHTVEEIDLSFKNISKILPNQFDKFLHVKKINLSNNNITSINAATFVNLKELVEVNLDNNPVSNYNTIIFENGYLKLANPPEPDEENNFEHINFVNTLQIPDNGQDFDNIYDQNNVGYGPYEPMNNYKFWLNTSTSDFYVKSDNRWEIAGRLSLFFIQHLGHEAHSCYVFSPIFLAQLNFYRFYYKYLTMYFELCTYLNRAPIVLNKIGTMDEDFLNYKNYTSNKDIEKKYCIQNPNSQTCTNLNQFYNFNALTQDFEEIKKESLIRYRNGSRTNFDSGIFKYPNFNLIDLFKLYELDEFTSFENVYFEYTPFRPEFMDNMRALTGTLENDIFIIYFDKLNKILKLNYYEPNNSEPNKMQIYITGKKI